MSSKVNQRLSAAAIFVVALLAAYAIGTTEIGERFWAMEGFRK